MVPLLPFGIKKYDDGERFDLRSPYSDGGCELGVGGLPRRALAYGSSSA